MCPNGTNLEKDMFVKNGDGDSNSKITEIIEGGDLTAEQKANIKKKVDSESADLNRKKSGDVR